MFLIGRVLTVVVVVTTGVVGAVVTIGVRGVTSSTGTVLVGIVLVGRFSAPQDGLKAER